MNREIERIRDQLHKAVHGGAWHGPSVLEAAELLSPSAARVRRPPSGHSALQILLHIASWLEISRERMEGRAVTPTAEMDWPKPAGEGDEAWDAARARVRSAHEALDRTLASLSDADLDRTAAGKDYSLYFLAHGVIQHSLYHAGQIVLFARMAEAGA